MTSLDPETTPILVEAFDAAWNDLSAAGYQAAVGPDPDAMRERATSGYEAGGTNPMPIYEFQCHHCGGRIEELMRLSDPDPVDCPSCSKPGLKRQVTAPSFRLAGSGWYETDFKKGGDKKRNLVEGSSTSESKPEPKPADPAPASKPAASSE